MKENIVWLVRECKIWLLEIAAKTDKILARFLPLAARRRLKLAALFYCCLVPATLVWIIAPHLLFAEKISAGTHYIISFIGVCVPYAVLWAAAVGGKKQLLNIVLTACMAAPWLFFAQQSGVAGTVIKTAVMFILLAGVAGDLYIANKNMDTESLIKLHKRIVPYIFKCFMAAIGALALHALLT